MTLRKPTVGAISGSGVSDDRQAKNTGLRNHCSHGLVKIMFTTKKKIKRQGNRV